jgi:hypothetical protein
MGVQHMTSPRLLVLTPVEGSRIANLLLVLPALFSLTEESSKCSGGDRWSENIRLLPCGMLFDILPSNLTGINPSPLRLLAKT